MRVGASRMDAGAWAVPAACLCLAALLWLVDGNRALFLVFNGLWRYTGESFWSVVTVGGDTVVAASLCLLLLAWRQSLLLAFAPAALACTAWIHFLKPLVDSDRPLGVLPAQAVHVIGPAYHFHSFPSGHAATAFLVAGLVVQGYRLRARAGVPLLLAVLVAVSRSAVGVHWPLDTLAGAFGGWLAACFGLWAAPRLRGRGRDVTGRLVLLALAGCAVALLLGYNTHYPQAQGFVRVLALASLVAGTFALLLRRQPW